MNTNEKLEYISSYSEFLNSFLGYKRSLGYSYGDTNISLLKDLDVFLYRHSMNATLLSRETVSHYIARRSGECPRTQLKRISTIRQFAVFMRSMGYDYYVCPPIRIATPTFTPYIFLKEEIHRLIYVTDCISLSAWSRYYHRTYPMLVRLLYGCGIRIDEALSLKISDVDLEKGTVLIHGAKYNKSRLLPMSSSLTDYCRFYSATMNFNSGEVYFLPSRCGGKYNYSSVHEKMKQFMTEAGIFKDNGEVPRIHDIRHTFAVHALERMADLGMDLYCSLPHLSIYLGHVGIESTEKYLWFTSVSRERIINSVSSLYEGIFPEVDYEE